MKRYQYTAIIYCIGIFSILCSCAKKNENTFTIEGYIVNVVDSIQQIDISYPIKENGIWVKKEDSTSIIDGRFSFSGNIDGLTEASLYWDQNSISFLLEAGNIKLNIDNKQPYSYTIEGGNTTFSDLNSFEIFLANEEQIYGSRVELIQTLNAYNACMECPQRDSLLAHLEDIISEREGLFTETTNIYLSLIAKNRDSNITPIMLYKVANSYTINKDSLNSIFNGLSKEAQKSLMGEFVKKKIEIMSPSIVQKEGDIAVDFEKKDINDNLVKLQNYKSSKYVLLDFWASWCGPCIAGLPTIALLCDEYKQEDLVIIGVSCDTDTKAWKNAVSKYNLNKWIQIKATTELPENAIFNENISDWYDVKAIPCYFFINKEGVVLKKWEHIGQEELDYIREQVGSESECKLASVISLDSTM